MTARNVSLWRLTGLRIRLKLDLVRWRATKAALRAMRWMLDQMEPSG